MTDSRAMMRPPIAAWIATSKSCRGMSCRIFWASARPRELRRVAVDDDGERVDRVAVHQDVELHQRRLPVAGQVVVERRVAAGEGLEPVVEVEHDLGERELVGDEHPVRRPVLDRLLDAALLLAQREDAADVLREGVRTMAVMTGSSKAAIGPASGSLAGLSTSWTSPSPVVTR